MVVIAGVAVLMSSTAMALFSCSEMKAVRPSAVMAMASGSMSWARVVVTPALPVMRMPRLLSSALRLFQALKSTDWTWAWPGATGVVAR